MPDLGNNTLTADEEIAQRSGFNTSNVLSVLGAGLLGGAGPAGIAAASKMTENEQSLREQIRERERENLQLQEKAKITSAETYIKKIDEFGADAVSKLDPQAQQEVIKAYEDANVLLGRPASTPMGTDAQDDKSFTLGAGQKRFDPAGNEIASIAPKPTDKVNPFITFVNPENQSQAKSVRRDSPAADKLASAGWVKSTFEGAPKDLTKAAVSKSKVEFQAMREGQLNLEKRVNRTKELLLDPSTKRGFLGNLVGVAESVSDQIRQATGEALFDGDKVNPAFLSEDDNTLDPVTRSAIISGKINANIVSIAAMLARANNPDGRISDRDMKDATDMVQGDQGSIPVAIAALDEIVNISSDRLESRKQVLIEDKIISGDTQTRAVNEMSVEEMQAELEGLKRGR